MQLINPKNKDENFSVDFKKLLIIISITVIVSWIITFIYDNFKYNRIEPIILYSVAVILFSLLAGILTKFIFKKEYPTFFDSVYDCWTVCIPLLCTFSYILNIKITKVIIMKYEQ